MRGSDCRKRDGLPITGSVVIESKGGTGAGTDCIILTGSTISTPKQIKTNGGCLIVP